MKRPYLMFTLLALLFIAPGLAAYVVYQHPHWLVGATNRGQWVQPPKTLTVLPLDKRWHLVYWSPEACEQRCASRLDDLARIRLALGRRLYHVDVALLLNSKSPQLNAEVLDELETQGSHWFLIDKKDERKYLGMKPAIYLVTPSNQMILRYHEAQIMADIFHDIQQMVKNT